MLDPKVSVVFQRRRVLCRVETLILRPVTGTDCDVARIPAAPRRTAPHRPQETGVIAPQFLDWFFLLPGSQVVGVGDGGGGVVVFVVVSLMDHAWRHGILSGMRRGCGPHNPPLADGSLPASSEISIQLQAYLSRVSRLNLQQRAASFPT